MAHLVKYRAAQKVRTSFLFPVDRPFQSLPREPIPYLCVGRKQEYIAVGKFKSQDKTRIVGCTVE